MALEELEHAHRPEPGTETTHLEPALFGPALAVDTALCADCGRPYTVGDRPPGLFDELAPELEEEEPA